MTISPIKSIVRNLTGKRFIAIVSSNVRIVLEGKGKPGDTANLTGDVFSYFETTSAADGFMDSLLSEKVSLTYVIDSVVAVERNTKAPNFSGSAKTTERIKNFNRPSISEVPLPPVGEILKDCEVTYAKDEVKEEPKEEPPVVDEPKAEPAKEEPVVAEVKPEPVVEAPSEVAEEKKVEELKPEKKTRKSKQIVLN